MLRLWGLLRYTVSAHGRGSAGEGKLLIQLAFARSAFPDLPMTLPATPADRYAASLRLSVAPMMDWTEAQRKVLQINGIK